MNLLFSYSMKQDYEADAKGYKFLGAAKDSNNSEVHVFEIMPLEEANRKIMEECE